MKQFKFGATTPSTALVIVFPVGVRGLFNPQVHSLVREVQEKLDNVYVTYALSSGSPTVADAIAASKFAGCEAAVVVHAGDDLSSDLARFGSGADSPIRGSLGLAEMTPSTVVSAYMTALAGASRAA